MPAAEDILCGEIGSPEGERWSPPVRLSAQETAAVEALVADEVLQTRDDLEGLSIAGIDRVGTIQLPGGRRVHIRPKVGDLVLLDWLAYVGDAPPLAPRAAGGSFALRGGFAARVAESFLGELERLTHRSLRAAF